MGGIAAKAPTLWLHTFLNRKGTLPSDLQWLTSPSSHSDFLRHSVISWLLTNSIDLSVMGIASEEVAGPPTIVRGKRTRKVSDVVIIADDDDSDGKTAGSPLRQGIEDVHQWHTVSRK